VKGTNCSCQGVQEVVAIFEMPLEEALVQVQNYRQEQGTDGTEVTRNDVAKTIEDVARHVMPTRLCLLLIRSLVRLHIHVQGRVMAANQLCRETHPHSMDGAAGCKGAPMEVGSNIADHRSVERNADMDGLVAGAIHVPGR